MIDNKQELLRIPSTFAIMFGDSTHGTVGLGQCSIAFNKFVRRVDGLDILKIVQEVLMLLQNSKGRPIKVAELMLTLEPWLTPGLAFICRINPLI